MSVSNFTTAILVEQSQNEVYNAINNVRGWWSEEIEGNTDQLNQAFLYHYRDVHICKIKVIEMNPNEKVVWHVLENRFNFIQNQNEWKDTKIVFEITKKGKLTQLNFTHEGLTPEDECYDVCNEAWNNYIKNSLRNLITEGKGEPNKKEGGFNEELAKKWNLI